MLRIEHPDLLWLLVAVPAIGLVLALVSLRQAKALRSFVNEALLADLAPLRSPGKRVMKSALVLLAMACLVLAAANPQVGTRLEEVKREGIDLFVALDVSLSMKAEDIRPSRLDKAKRDVSSLLKQLSGDRVGLIVFAGDAFVQFPLTADYAAADLFISAVDVDAVPTPGTIIAGAIEMALQSFSTDLPTQKAVIVVSDGENTEGDVLGAVEQATKAGVRVYSVGMGTPDGGPIPLYDNAGNRTDFKRDRGGSIVLTKLDESMLQEIATTTGGAYRRATSGGNEIDDIFKELATLEKTEFGVKQVTGFESRYHYPLALAILLLFIDALMSERRGKMSGWWKKFLPAAAMLLLVPLALEGQTVRSHVVDGNEQYGKREYTEAEVDYKKALQVDPKSREARFNLGNAQYKQQRFEEALREYGTSAMGGATEKERANAYFNMGNALYQGNKYQESIGAYTGALKLNPGDEDARYNLQMAREKLRQQQEQQQQQKQDKNQQQQDQKQQDQKQQQNQDQQQDQQQQRPQPQSPEQQKADQDQTRQQKAEQQKHQMPKQEAERILEALRNNEKEIQKKLQRREGRKVKVEKDW